MLKNKIKLNKELPSFTNSLEDANVCRSDALAFVRQINESWHVTGGERCGASSIHGGPRAAARRLAGLVECQ